MKCYYCKWELKDCKEGVDYVIEEGYPICEGCLEDRGNGLGDTLRDDLEGIGVTDDGGES